MKARLNESRWMPRFGRRWIPLENASKIFLATFDEIDTKVYRFTVGLKAEVDPERLQRAVDYAFDHMDLYRASIRRGIFWYYFEESPLRPVVKQEKDVPCASIYSFEYRGLLFRVLYNGKRIHLEVFHALSDGSGALTFFRMILNHYFGSEPLPMPVLSPDDEHMLDSFKSSVKPGGRPSLFALATGLVQRVRTKRPAVFHMRGTPTVDERMRVIEIQCGTKDILALSKSYGVTVTEFLTALFMLSIFQENQGKRQKKRVMSIAVSVDLRQMFPSKTARNFFATVLMQYDFRKNLAQLDAVCQSVKAQFVEKITPDRLEKKLRQLMKLEESLALRSFPRPVKDQILKIANFFNNRAITAAMTNTGRLGLEEHASQIEFAGIMTAAVRPQFSIMSHGDVFTISFTSPFQNDEVQARFISHLDNHGIAMKVYGNRVYGNEEKQKVKVDTSLYPDVPPRFNSPKVLQWLLFFSVLIAGTALIYRNLVPNTALSLRFIAVLIIGLWAVVISLVRKRRNPNKAVLYQVGIFSGMTILWDFLSGWTGWSLNYATPFIITTALIAGSIMAKFSRLRSGDKVLYLQGVALLGLIPMLLMVFQIVTPLWPSVVVVVASLLLLIYTLVRFWEDIQRELRKRFHI